MTSKLGRAVTLHGLMDLVALAFSVLFAWFMWPASLGGSTRFIVVVGHSMEPTYQPGELVILDTDARYEVGDTVVYQIPAGQLGAGRLVIHRLIGIRDDGTYISQGDNRETADSFVITDGDIVGSPRFSIPYGGNAISVLGSPIGLGMVVGTLSTVLLWPRQRPAQTFAFPRLAVDEHGWSSVSFSKQHVLDAQAWLQSQLATHVP